MKYKNSYNISVDFMPWFDKDKGHCKFTSLQLYEELCGQIAYGMIELVHDGSDVALKLITDQYTGDLTIKDEKEGGLIYEIPIFIVNREFSKNYIKLNFICIKNKSFAFDLHSSEWTDIGNTIKSLYPGNSDIRVDSDIQNSKIKYFQNNETDLDFISRLCWSYKKESVFSFGWEGLMIKEIMGKSDHLGNNEKPKPKLWIREDSDLLQIDTDYDLYNRELYKLPYNCWEDTTGKKEPKDYTQLEPVNMRVIKRSGGIRSVGTDYLPLLENRKYNMLYNKSNYYNSFRVKMFDIPRYKIGDVLGYKKESIIHSNKNWPFNYFLVKSNELFISIEGSDLADEDGFHFSWVSKLMGLEDNGTVALGKEDDPTDNLG